MKRREFITLLGGAAAAWPLAARAQQPAMPVIGFLPNSVRRRNGAAARISRRPERGRIVEGQNVAIEYRWAEDQLIGCPRWRPIWYASGSPSSSQRGPLRVVAAKAATPTIPIVFLIGDDPVKLGLVASLDRPGGNLTGINLNAAS